MSLATETCIMTTTMTTWSAEAATFVCLLARCQSWSAPSPSHAAAISAYTLRWFALLSLAAASSFTASLMLLPFTGTANVDGELPTLNDILAAKFHKATARSFEFVNDKTTPGIGFVHLLVCDKWVHGSKTEILKAELQPRPQFFKRLRVYSAPACSIDGPLNGLSRAFVFRR
ncbi:hypothetical protein AK812_SmicGene35267 [Symbiodinium microadriaticum]|uniref:Uncharacterized protein n=1 Tax=Symbiodinium microadriaticum TaxID=2951 RepID=A0A1Q9CLX2_SYMMI|nr:hypothetical protein AK812_SmicGene35267 [Symbiodinium microadriaticum]CAE7881854.1 unnamed protein product [Symbiodinium sp. KB8]